MGAPVDMRYQRNAMQRAIASMCPSDRQAFLSEVALIYDDAYRLQGPKAFEFTKSAAAAHEAGHCVHFEMEGFKATSARIFVRKFDGRISWLGTTLGCPAWKADLRSDPANDLKNARLQLGGIIGEILLEGIDFRLASSIDELLMARELVRKAAAKTGRDPTVVFISELHRVARFLIRNRSVHQELRDLLVKSQTVRGKPLQRLLSKVRPPAEGGEAAYYSWVHSWLLPDDLEALL